MNWKDKIVTPDEVFERIEPGMSIFIGTGGAEPRTLVKRLMESEDPNLEDLELIQLVSFGDAISLEKLDSRKYRLKTFFSGGIASEAITTGQVDLIPSRFSAIPHLLAKSQMPLDVAFVQVTPPNDSGYCSLGTSVDVSRIAMEQADLVVGEINREFPHTFGDAFVHISDFDMLIKSKDRPIVFPRWDVPEVFDKVAQNVASVIENGACIGFTIGPLYEALGRHLVHKRNLGIHSPFFTDTLMDLVESGAVTNRFKKVFRGKSLASYALGTKDLLRWLDRNPLVEFQGIDKVFSPLIIGKNPNTFFVFPARKVGLSGRVALHYGKGNIAAGPGEAVDFVNGAELSQGGRSAFALPSRNKFGEPNIKLHVKDYPNQFSLREAVDMVITEYGVAYLRGRTLRERAQSLIEVAHPDDRPELLEEAKKAKIIYQDQIFVHESAHLYPSNIATTEVFKNDTEVRFRAIKPSDEEGMRKLFYRFSDDTVYYRYFTRIRTMPHAKMQEYVNVDYRKALSIVGLLGEPGYGHIIAEARFVKVQNEPFADVAFVVDEKYQGMGIATHMMNMLIRLAKEQGIQGFTADVLATNKRMIKVFEKVGLPVRACLQEGAYELRMFFDENVGKQSKHPTRP